MPTKEEFDAAFAEINDATNNIADDITRLHELLTKPGLSEEEQNAALEELKGVATKLKAIAAVTPETSGEPPVEPPVEG